LVKAAGFPELYVVVAILGAALLIYSGPYAAWVASLPPPLKWLLSFGAGYPFDATRNTIRINAIVFGILFLLVGGGLLVAMATGVPVAWSTAGAAR
jgi:hypothetical protein